MRGISEPKPIPLRVYWALQIQAKERQEKMRPDYILMEKEKVEMKEMSEIKEYGDTIYPETIPIKCSNTLAVLREEKELKMRPDFILVEKEKRETKEDLEYIKQERYHRLWGAVNSLSDRQKTFFVMRYGEGMGFSVKQLAEDFKVSGSAIRMHIKRAKKNLRKKLPPLNKRTERLG